MLKGLENKKKTISDRRGVYHISLKVGLRKQLKYLLHKRELVQIFKNSGPFHEAMPQLLCEGCTHSSLTSAVI